MKTHAYCDIVSKRHSTVECVVRNECDCAQYFVCASILPYQHNSVELCITQFYPSEMEKAPEILLNWHVKRIRITAIQHLFPTITTFTRNRSVKMSFFSFLYDKGAIPLTAFGMNDVAFWTFKMHVFQKLNR